MCLSGEVSYCFRWLCLIDGFEGMHSVGYIIALLCGTYPSDKFGRRIMILVVQSLMALACITEMLATEPPHWIAAKMIAVSWGLHYLLESDILRGTFRWAQSVNPDHICGRTSPSPRTRSFDRYLFLLGKPMEFLGCIL